MAVSIKVSEENYKRLVSLSGKLQEQWHKPVSINATIDFLYTQKLGDLAGRWKMNNKEAENIKRELKKGWKQWNKRYA